MSNHLPELWDIYLSLVPIQQVDLAKYMVIHEHGGLYSDLDVLPLAHPDEIVGDSDYVFDWCSRKGVVANDFLYSRRKRGLPGIFDYFVENLKRIEGIEIYKRWPMRRIFQTSGPDFLTRYVKRSGLKAHVQAISERAFLDPKQRRRRVTVEDPKIRVLHHLSWAPLLLSQNAS